VKSNQFWALLWIILAVSWSPLQQPYSGILLVFNLLIAGYFYWRAVKAGEFK